MRQVPYIDEPADHIINNLRTTRISNLISLKVSNHLSANLTPVQSDESECDDQADDVFYDNMVSFELIYIKRN